MLERLGRHQNLQSLMSRLEYCYELGELESSCFRYMRPIIILLPVSPCNLRVFLKFILPFVFY